MSEWVVRKRARELAPGERFVFDEDLGGEGETLTVVAVAEAFGTASIETEEVDFEIDVQSSQWLTMTTGAPDD